ncbi:hypothetical protein FFWV33_04710 [Flavobacterium faecale]|uniref:Uncharacterized protein n=1 Tax=Flavobacterium faecale TaxID=1355330 RepID=A0A2S1LAY2_9FLAO|nr:hypothetical protein [Flavobacterium faecale]AWG20891.1 hypothetical protein FFWV33_04710 [Flavobacterium faecale]
MKNSILLLSVVTFVACSSKKDIIENKEIQLLTQLKPIIDTLDREESNIVNDFLDFELASERYKNYKNYEIILIEEAGNVIENLLVYEYAYKDFHSYGNKATADDNERLGWILDTIQIKELKNTYKDKNECHWTSSDIRNFKVTIMKNDTLRNIINTRKYINLPEKLILHVTKPLILNSDTAFISFRLRLLGVFHSINNYTALMKKVNGKWQIRADYSDGSVE